MKKFISIITLLALLVATLTIFASCGSSASKEVVRGSDDKISWSYDPTEKSLTITGDNVTPKEMNAYTKGGETPAPWYQYRTTAEKLTISGVSKISANAFYSMYALKSITFLDSHITEIGDFAFAFCSSLESVNLPTSLTKIGTSAFEACVLLKEVKIPAKVTSIGERAFAINNSLTSVTMSQIRCDAINQVNDDGVKPIHSIFFGISIPTIPTYAVDENGNEVQPPVESETPESNETTDASEATETTETTETTAPAETNAAEKEPVSTTTTIIVVVIFALVVIGIVVGMVLIMRSNSKLTKDSQTVRKNDNDKNNKNNKNNKNSKYNKNGKSKGKKK